MGAGLGKDRGDAQSAADANNLPGVAHMAGNPHRSSDAEKHAAWMANALHLLGRFSHRLNDKSHGSLVAVEIGNGQRDALAMLIGDDNKTTVAYISNTNPIPRNKESIAVCTAIAGEMLGLKLIYLDAGSGAQEPVPSRMVQAVKSAIKLPLIVGGGINTLHKANDALASGADMLVIGNGLEDQKGFFSELTSLMKTYNDTLNIHQ